MNAQWTGAREAGWAYSTEDVARVRDTLVTRHVGREQAVTLEDLSLETGIEGRPLRAIISEIDGVNLLVGYTRRRVFVAEFIEDGAGWTKRLLTIIESMTRRANRRVSFSSSLPPRQWSLDFDEDDEDDDGGLL